MSIFSLFLKYNLYFSSLPFFLSYLSAHYLFVYYRKQYSLNIIVSVFAIILGAVIAAG